MSEEIVVFEFDIIVKFEVIEKLELKMNNIEVKLGFDFESALVKLNIMFEEFDKKFMDFVFFESVLVE